VPPAPANDAEKEIIMNIQQILKSKAPRTTDDQGNQIIMRPSPYHPGATVVSFIGADGYWHSNIGNVQDDGVRIGGYPDSTDFLVEYYNNQVRR
jgi:hypothetical protein